MNAKKTLLFLLISSIVISCNNYHYKDYSSMYPLAKNNHTEIKKLISYYLAQKDEFKLKATEHILDNLKDQYSIKYFLLKPTLDTKNKPDTIWLNKTIAKYDSVALKLSSGYKLMADTTKDIENIKSAFLINHIEQAVASWKYRSWNRKITFSYFTQNILPYRAQNETLSDFTNIFHERYQLKELIKPGLNQDSIASIIDFINTQSASSIDGLNGVDLLSSINYKDVLNYKTRINEWEDLFLAKLLLQRSSGIAATAYYAPGVRNSTNVIYAPSNATSADSGHISKQNLANFKTMGISKLYEMAFEKKNWDNPYDKLLKAGIPATDIPLSLLIPKMKDITKDVTPSKNIVLQVPDTLMTNKVLYICNYAAGNWKAVSWGLVDKKHKTVSFKDMGANMLYQLASCKSEIIKPINSPFILQPDGELKFLNRTNKVYANPIKWTKKLAPKRTYTLQYWVPSTQNWKTQQKVTVSKDSLLHLMRLNNTSLYRLIAENNFTDAKNIRVFSVNRKNEISTW